MVSSYAREMTTRLEGPGADRRLRDINRRFRRSSPRPRPRRRSASLFAWVFGLVFVAALLVMERPGLVSDLTAPLRLAGAADDQPYRYFSGCDEARAAGAAPIYRWQSGYREEMDGDNDGVACEPRWR